MFYLPYKIWQQKPCVPVIKLLAPLQIHRLHPVVWCWVWDSVTTCLFAGCSLPGSAIQGTGRRDCKAVNENGLVPSCCLIFLEVMSQAGMARHLIRSTCFQPPSCFSIPEPTSWRFSESPAAAARALCSGILTPALWGPACRPPSGLWMVFPTQLSEPRGGAPCLASRSFPVFSQPQGILLSTVVNSVISVQPQKGLFSPPTPVSPIPFNKYPLEIFCVVSVLLTGRLWNNDWCILSSFAQAPNPVPNSVVCIQCCFSKCLLNGWMNIYAEKRSCCILLFCLFPSTYVITVLKWGL